MTLSVARRPFALLALSVEREVAVVPVRTMRIDQKKGRPDWAAQALASAFRTLARVRAQFRVERERDDSITNRHIFD